MTTDNAPSPGPTPAFEADYDADGFADANRIQFDLRRMRFECKPITMKLRTELAEKLRGGIPEDEFFEAVLQPEHHEAFLALANDPDNPLRSSTIRAIMNYLVTELTGLPTTSDGKDGDPKEST